jgi:chorismate lyase / 3-hydroxybenzoate synthase
MNPNRPDVRGAASHPVRLAYVQYVPQATQTLLGEIHFGASPALPDLMLHPAAWVGMPLLDGAAHIELWTSEQPVAAGRIGPLTFARNRDVLFGCFVADSPADFSAFEARIQEAYARLLTLIDSEGYPHLLRVWNYFPGIGEREGSLDRYMVFCRGRYQALEAHYGKLNRWLPAASAVGTRHGGIVIYFFAGREPGRHRENPRQMSAYCYPPQYGPKSPSFARATLVSGADRDRLYISGTASIIGHESRHLDDPAAQLEETLANIKALIDSAATEEGARFDGLASLTHLKVYIRRARDFPLIRARLGAMLPKNTQCLYLEAEVCRPELLLEIEAVASTAHD